MGNFVFAGIAPHPPIIIDEVGGGQNQDAEKTIAAMKKWAKEVKDSKPDLIIIITPHGNLFQDAIAIQGSTKLKGDFSSFGVKSNGYEFINHKELQQEIVKKAEENGYSMVEVNENNANKYGLKKDLDHGVLVPLDFILKEGVEVPLVVISMALLDNVELYRFGMLIEEVVHDKDFNVAIIASADLSHRLTKTAPAGYDPAGKDFDLRIGEIVKTENLIEFLDIDEELVEKAGECGLRSLIMLAGALDSYKVTPILFNYEGPFGVGYLVSVLNIEKSGTSSIKEWSAEKNKSIAGTRENESLQVQLARESLTYFLETGNYLSIPDEIPESLKQKKSCFVSLKKNGHLRGCIGTIEPVRTMLAQEIIENSVSAGVRDPRFLPVKRDELDEIVISVDVLSKPEKVKSTDQLDPMNYGIIVKSKGRSGVLLPNLEGVDTVEKQLEITLSKAEISQDEDYIIYRFKVDRFY
ncbi:MAG: hypothetical protein APF76_01450 [Desulfitibacter sp. BRH_c19]|nr:MAG: hypothetical protein APF76_01450 [Desulfitibacter sp. BRH_c19]